MDQETLTKLEAITGANTYLYELARQSICEHDVDGLEVVDNKIFCGTCNKKLHIKEIANLLGR